MGVRSGHGERQTVVHPVERTRHLLRLRGLDVLEERAVDRAVDGALLMEVMEAREDLEDAAAARSEERLRALATHAEAELAAALDQVAAAFEGDSGGSRDNDALAAAAVRVQYMAKLNFEVREQLDVL